MVDTMRISMWSSPPAYWMSPFTSGESTPSWNTFSMACWIVCLLLFFMKTTVGWRISPNRKRFIWFIRTHPWQVWVIVAMFSLWLAGVFIKFILCRMLGGSKQIWLQYAQASLGSDFLFLWALQEESSRLLAQLELVIQFHRYRQINPLMLYSTVSLTFWFYQQGFDP